LGKACQWREWPDRPHKRRGWSRKLSSRLQAANLENRSSAFFCAAQACGPPAAPSAPALSFLFAVDLRRWEKFALVATKISIRHGAVSEVNLKKPSGFANGAFRDVRKIKSRGGGFLQIRVPVRGPFSPTQDRCQLLQSLVLRFIYNLKWLADHREGPFGRVNPIPRSLTTGVSKPQPHAVRPPGNDVFHPPVVSVLENDCRSAKVKVKVKTKSLRSQSK